MSVWVAVSSAGFGFFIASLLSFSAVVAALLVFMFGCGSFATTFENSFQWLDSRAFFDSVT
jgi:hypothetical protein